MYYVNRLSHYVVHFSTKKYMKSLDLYMHKRGIIFVEKILENIYGDKQYRD